MKRYLFTISVVLGMMACYSCKKEEIKAEGNPTIKVETEITSALFGDSLQFKVNASDDEVPLSTLKARLFFSDEMVSETIIRTKTNGDYTGKIYIPYYANIPDGTATLKLVLQNINLTITEQVYELPLKRPDFPYLTLVTENETYRMERTALYEYAATTEFPLKVNGYIKAPAVGDAGNELTFGWEDSAIQEGVMTEIPFSNNFSGQYDITFNTFDYTAAPFIIAYSINGTAMNRIDDDNFKLDLDLTQGEELTIEGIDDIDSWWIDRDFFGGNAGDVLTFLPQSGRYRITADFAHKYFIVEALDGNDVAKLKTDGTGAIWIIGEGVGKPSLSANAVGWTTEKALCMAPIGNKKYQITLVAGGTVSADDLNFKFFHQKDWGGEFNNSTLSTTSDLIFIGDGNNGRDAGNLGILEGKTLEEGATYLFTVDLKDGNDKAVLTVVKQ